jgi:hypothetical protein
MVKHYTENFRDKLQVQVSTNGTTWTAIAGSTTVQEPGTVDDATINGQPAMTGIQDYWIPVSYDLSSVLNNASVRLRFVFTSDNDLSTFTKDVDDGFYIDNLSVVKSSSPMNILPVQFLSFTAALQSDRTVDLAWEAAIDNDHAYFTIERSEDGITFRTLGSPDLMTPFIYTDNKPAVGNNYYRIRQVDVSGKVSYSVVRTVNVEDPKGIYVYPNPAKDVLYVKVTSFERERLRFELTDIQGRLISNTIREVDAATSQVSLNLGGLKPQVYVLKVIDTQGKVVATERVTKL